MLHCLHLGEFFVFNETFERSSKTQEDHIGNSIASTSLAAESFLDRVIEKI